MENFLSFFKNNWADIWVIFTSIVTIASIIAKLTPSPTDDKLVLQIINFLALNKKKSPS